MKDLRAILRHADPLRDEPALAIADVRAIRAAVLGAAETPAPLLFPRALPVAALVVVMIVAGMAAGQRIADREPARAAAGPDAGAPSGDGRRQVQFATPGGTRIIWTIDPDFQLRGLP